MQEQREIYMLGRKILLTIYTVPIRLLTGNGSVPDN